MFCSALLFSQADTIEIPYEEALTWPEEFSVRFDLGVGMISNTFEEDIENLSISNGAAGNLGVVWVHHYKGPALFRMEFTVMNVQSRENMKAFSYVNDTGKVISYQDDEVRKTMTYITMPIMVGLEFSRFYINGGIQGGMLMTGKGYTRNLDYYVKKPVPEEVFADFDFGFRGGIGFRFAKHLYMEASYYHGLGNVCSGRADAIGQTWMIQQATFGIRYSFHYYKPVPTIDLFDLEELEDL